MRKAIFLLPLLLIAASLPPSIILNQPNPHFADTVTFTATYPKEAAIKVGKQQMNNPDVQVDCYRDNVRIFTNNTSFTNEIQNGDGTMTGVSGPVYLGGTSNNNTWTEGGAFCYATLYYFSRIRGSKSLELHVLDQTTFEVTP